MPVTFRLIPVLVVSLLVGGVSVVLAPGSSAEQPPTATLVAPQSPPTTYAVRGMHGQMVTVDVPAMGAPAIQLTDPVQRTVQATVLVVDGQKHQVHVRTQQGQMLVLDLPPESVQAMRIGDQFTLSVMPASGQ